MRSAFAVVYTASGLIAVLMAVLSARRRRETPLAVPLAVIMAGAAFWSLAQACAVAAPTAARALFFSYAIFPGVAMVVAAFFWRSALAAGRLRERPRRLLLLLVHPVLLLVAVATDPWHHAFFRGFEVAPDGAPVVHPGPLYWLHTAYSYALMTAGVILVVRAMGSAVRGQRRGYLVFLAGGSAPVVGNLVTLFADVNAQRFDLTPVLFMISGLVWWWAERAGLNRERVPVAYKQVLAALGDAVMVLDPAGKFLDVNPAAAELLAVLHPESRGAAVGRQWREIAGPHFADLLTDTMQTTVTTVTSRNGAVYDVRVVRMRADDGASPGTVVVVRDVTELERLRAELTDQVVRDGLTGVYNRRHLTAVLDSRAQDQVLSLVLIDVDHFKAVNDRYGHAVGDQVLIRIAQNLSGAVRQTDTVARYGGEEFVVVMPGTGARAAAGLAEEWRRRCASAAVETPLGPLTATFSAGVAEMVPGDGPDDLLRRADQALYQAKRAGRDQVVVAGHPAALALDPGPRLPGA